MAQLFKTKELIQKPVDLVWEVLTDWTNAPKWMVGVDEMWVAGGNNIVEGTQLTFHARGAARTSLISHCDPGKSITLRSVQSGVTADYTYDLRSIDANITLIKLDAQCQSKNIMWRIFFPLLRIAIKRVDGKQLKNLKQYIES